MNAFITGNRAGPGNWQLCFPLPVAASDQAGMSLCSEQPGRAGLSRRIAGCESDLPKLP